MNTPILLIIYNRPDEFSELILSLEKIKPSNIFIYSDGPKNKTDAVGVIKCRNLIKKITWTKNIKTNFSKKNMGCQLGPINAISWFFNNVKKGIILEDDCIPNQSFFNFTSELLDFYENDKRISQINGFNFGHKLANYKYDYYFSIYAGGWGWATWKSRWEEYVKADLKKMISNKDILSSLKKNEVESSFLNNVKNSLSGKLDAWDYMWTFFNMTQNRLSIIPQKNLISNIGFGENATHTKILTDMQKILKEVIVGDLKHPVFILANNKVDKIRSLNHNRCYQLYRFVKNKLNIFN